MLIGFDSVVWCPIILSSIGGITVAVVIKFADNIVKSFAGSVSIIVACIASSLLFEFRPNALFLVGTALAIGSIFMYNLFPYARKYAQASTDPPNTTQLKEEIAAAWNTVHYLIFFRYVFLIFLFHHLLSAFCFLMVGNMRSYLNGSIDSNSPYKVPSILFWFSLYRKLGLAGSSSSSDIEFLCFIYFQMLFSILLAYILQSFSSSFIEV